MGWMDILIILLSYLLGCINTGYYYTRIFYKKDIRTVGTNVTGATNVGRIAGNKGFVITFAGDTLKGALVVFICRRLELSELTLLISILAVVAGHILPFQLKLHGGKGIATLFGALLAFEPILILYLGITCVVVFLFIRRFTITSLVALLLLPLELFVADYSLLLVFFSLLFAVLIIFACRTNVQEYIKVRAYQGKR